MRAGRFWFGLLGTLALAGPPLPAAAQPDGSEFQVNTYTTSDQRTRFYPDHLVAADAGGNLVAVWEGQGQGDISGVFGQRYDSAGAAVGSEFRVNSYTAQYQRDPAVASDATGNFVVAWTSFGQDGDGAGAFAQRYDSTGRAVGMEFRVNSFTTGPQGTPTLASDAKGNFVVVWTSSQLSGSFFDIFGQRYDSEGVAQGSEFQVNSFTDAHQRYPSIASDASGDFVVVWQGQAQDGNGYGVFGQRYDSAGVPRGVEFRANSFTTGDQDMPAVAYDASGNFVVVWQSTYQETGQGIFGQRYDSEGAARGDEFQINSYTTGHQWNPSVASDASGNFVVVWVSNSQDGSDYGIFGQRYDSAGEAQGNEFRVTSFTAGAQRDPSAGATGPGEFAVVWESDAQDGSGSGVFGQRFESGRAEAITVVVPSIASKWRIGATQEIRWTHNLGIDATFRIKLDRTDDGDYEEVIATAAPASSGDTGSFTWTVTGPPSRAARVRVSWTDDPSVSDASDVTFQIRPAN